MKKKQKINKAVNYGEWVLLGLTALFVCALFILRGRPVPERGLSVQTAAARAPASPVLPDSGAVAVPYDAQTMESGDAPPEDSGDTPATAENPSISPAPDAGGLVNLNTADIPTLCTLPGIGETLAGRIAAYREEHGPFAHPEDVMRVSGIGEGKFSAIKALVTV